VDVATPQARLKVIAILYHYEQVWYAAWLSPKQEADQYVYGHAYAFKNTAAAAKTAPQFIWNSKDKCIEHPSDRGVQTFTYSMNITKKDIVNESSANGWHAWPCKAVNLYCQKGYDINQQAVIPFEQSLREDIPTWEDSRGMFDRMRCCNVFDAAELPIDIKKHLDVEQGLTVEVLI
jgi:hypothetical protein